MILPEKVFFTYTTYQKKNKQTMGPFSSDYGKSKRTLLKEPIHRYSLLKVRNEMSAEKTQLPCKNENRKHKLLIHNSSFVLSTFKSTQGCYTCTYLR